MKTKLPCWFTVGLLTAVLYLPAHAQIPLWFSFTITPGYSLSDAYIIDTEPSEAYASITSLSNLFNGQTTFGPGLHTSAVALNGTKYGNPTYGTNFLTIIGVYSNATSTNVAITMPTWLANTYIPGGSWAAFDVSSNFYIGILPPETNTLSDLTNGLSQAVIVSFPFSYMPANDQVLVGPGEQCTFVAFDGAQNAGSFYFSTTPILSITGSGNQEVVSWPPAVTDWTLQTNTTLSAGSWGNYSGTIVNNSATITPMTGNLFFRLTQP
jgi:hypothetical protein